MEKPNEEGHHPKSYGRIDVDNGLPFRVFPQKVQPLSEGDFRCLLVTSSAGRRWETTDGITQAFTSPSSIIVITSSVYLIIIVIIIDIDIIINIAIIPSVIIAISTISVFSIFFQLGLFVWKERNEIVNSLVE